MALDAEKQLTLAVEARQFEIQMYWQRSNYFMVLNTAIAVGFFYILQTPFSPVLAALGVFACLCWLEVTFGAKYWQSRWEEAASNLEEKCEREVNLFSSSLDEVDDLVHRSLRRGNKTKLQKWVDRRVEGKPSVSYRMSLLALFFVVFWIIALLMSFILVLFI